MALPLVAEERESNAAATENNHTYDEIVLGLRDPDYRVANAALELLIREQRIGSESATITDKRDDRSRRVRLYFVRTF